MVKGLEGLEAVGGDAELASIVESSHDAIVGLDRDGMVSSWNPAAARLYGYAPREIISRSWEMIVPAELRADEAAILHRITAGEEVERYRSQRICRDGTLVAVSLTISPVVDQAGAVIGAAYAARRFTELQEARDRFEVRMAHLRDEAVDAADRFELQADEARDQAKHARERFEAGVDRERAQMQDAEARFRTSTAAPGAEPSLSQIDEERQEARDRFEARVADQRAEAHDAADRFETHVDESHDQARHAQQRFEGLVEDERAQAEEAANRFQARVDTEEDKTRREKEHLEAQLQQSQRLEVLGQLAGGVAHDFNNLLAVILNYAAFVAEELAATPQSESIAAAGRDVGQIQRAAERATALTHQLLSFARREVIQPRVVDLNHIVTDITQLLDRSIGEDVVLHTDLEADLRPVLADTGQIEQVLVNLAVNARDAMKGGGTLSIDTANINIDADVVTDGTPLPEGRYVRLRVGDTGTGMPADIIEHVFEPFYTTKSDGTGTGLGLATVHGIVAQADGTITIDSQPGVGTTFTIMLPVTDEVAAPVQQTAHYDHTPTGQTVLIVEDEQALRDVLERIFTRYGYHVITAADGEQALALVGDYHEDIHLLVTDVVMPKVLGTEVADAIRHVKPDTKVLYISGYARPVLASKGKLAPDVHLIEKPFTASAIIQKAGRLLRSA
jgi:PAS domain S-box-containing protein